MLAAPRLWLVVAGLATWLALLTPGAAQAQSPLVGQWHLDEVTSVNPSEIESDDRTPDSSGGGRHFESCNGCIGINSGGRFDSYYAETNGATSGLTTGAGANHPAVTLVAWIRTNLSSPTTRIIAGRGIDDATCQEMPYALRQEGADGPSGVSFAIRQPNGSSVSSPVHFGAGDNAWHMLAGTFDGSTVRLYVDGAQVGEGTPAETASIGYGAAQRFGIDGYTGSGCPHADFPGGIDEVREYSRALSATEIARLADPAATAPPALVPDAGPPPPDDSGPPPAPPPGPPDPTPPPPPEVTSLTQSSPHGAGAPLLVSANVEGEYTGLEWNVGREKFISEPGQTTLRLTPPKNTTVTVQPRGPGGLGGIQTVVVKPPVTAKDKTTKTIVNAINKTPMVLAWGPAALGQLLDPKKSTECSTDVRLRNAVLDVKGCLLPIPSLDDIPQAERGILTRVAQQYGIAQTEEALRKAVKLSNAWITYKPVSINGITVTPQAGAAIVIYPQAKAILSSKAKQAIGDLKLDTPPQFMLDTKQKAGEIALGQLKLASGALKAIGNFPLVKKVKVDIVPGVRVGSISVPQGVRVITELELPKWLQFGGTKIKGKVTLRATVDSGLILDALRIGPISTKIGPLAIEQLALSYTRAINEWRGQAKGCIPSGACLDMVPPKGELVIRDGELQSAGATLNFASPGLPLFAGVNMTEIGFRLGMNPTRIGGNAKVKAMKIYDINGRMNIAFPSAAAPFIFDRNEVGDGYPEKLYGQRFERTTFAAAADASITVPILKKVPLGAAYLVYEYPGYVAIGGGLDQSFLGLVSFTGRVDGEMNFATGRFNIMGSVNGCLIGVLCRGATGLISSRGFSLCLHLGIVNIGAGATFDPFDLTVWPLDGCKWSPYDEENVRGAAFAPGDPHEVRVGSDRTSRAISIEGVGEAPRIRVTGPDGKSLESPAESGLVNEGPVRIIRQESTKLTVVGLQDPAPGTYRIEPLPGSPEVKTIGEASDPPDAKVRAKVTGSGEDRVLSYDILERPAQQVTFTELGEGDTGRSIGVVKGGGKGTLRFKPSPGSAKRTIVAQFELAGMPAERKTVTTFAPPSPLLGKAGRLKVKRSGSGLAVSWRAVSGATRYEVVATADDGQRRLTTSKRSIRIAKVPAWAGGSVSVLAIATGREGRPVKRSFRATAKPPTGLLPLPKAPKLR